MTDQPQHTTRSRKGPLALMATVAGLGALAGLGTLVAVYGVVGASRNAGEPACKAALDVARRMEPLVHGEVAAVKVADEGLKLPDLAFHDGTGQPKSLADWHGRTVLLNLWATWCIPCRQEMPALDALEATLGGERFEVVAVNIDTRDAAKPRAWLKEVGVKALAYYADPSAEVFQDLKQVGRGFGLPTTVLVDPQRCEIGTAAGPAEWASQDGIALVRAALGA